MTGIFVVFEGPNGAGKSTVMDHTYRALKQNGHQVVVTKEPTDSFLGRLVRDRDGSSMDPTAYFFLVLADRYEHGRELRHLLEQNEFVLCDRYTGSSLVLNVLRGVPTSLVEAAHSSALLPDITLIVTARPDRLSDRMEKRARGITPGERMTTREEEYEAYNSLIESPSKILGRTIQIPNNGENPRDAVENIMKHLKGDA